MKCALLLVIAGCGAGPGYSFGPAGRGGDKPPDEIIGEGATLSIEVTHGTPLTPRATPPDWLARAGDPETPELHEIYGDKMFHAGRLWAHSKLEIKVDARGELAVAGCAPLNAVGKTEHDIRAAIEMCAEAFVDEPKTWVAILDNPDWSVEVRSGAKSKRLRVNGLTLSRAIAGEVGTGEDEVTSKRVTLITSDGHEYRMDVWRIITGKDDDVPLRAGDVIRIDAR